ncbi:hypothetical protein IWW38_005762, partial [Coemansia aciculifera]
MRSIVSELCAACYDPSIETKQSGCEGITFLVQDLHLGRAWLADNLLELSKALLFTLKDTHLNVIQSTEPAHSRETLLEIIRQAFPAAMFAPTEADIAEAMAVANCSDNDGNDNDEGAAMDTSQEASFDEVPETKPIPSSPVADSASANDVMDTSADSAGDNHETPEDDNIAISAGGDVAAEASSRPATPDGSAPTSIVSSIAASAAAVAAIALNNGSSADSDALLVDPVSEAASSEMLSVDARAEQLLEDSIVKSDVDVSVDGVELVVSSAASDCAASPVMAKPPSISMSTHQAVVAFQRLTARLTPENGRLIKSFLALITKELANPSTEVREAAKACLDIL